MKILNAETMRKNLIGKARTVRIYNNTAAENSRSVNAVPVYEETFKITTENWMGSAAREVILRDRKLLTEKLQKNFNERKDNASVGFDLKTIQALAGIYTIDLSRQADEYTDYTPVLFHQIVDENVPEAANLRDMAPYVGKEEVITGTGDTVPLMQPSLPEDYIVKQQILGFGDKTNYRQLIFNPFHKTEHIITSAARILADSKNNDSFGAILGATYQDVHKQAADTQGATYDLRLWMTLRAGLRKALRLSNKPMQKQNGLFNFEAYLLVNPMDLPDIQPVVSGILAGVGGIMETGQALQFDGIIPYGGGLNNGAKWGNETLKYPGVPLGKAYVFIKVDTFGGYRVIKRNETMDVGEGDIMALTSEKRVWHRIRGLFHDFILPEKIDGNGYGAVVEITLPEFSVG